MEEYKPTSLELWGMCLGVTITLLLAMYGLLSLVGHLIIE